jgi:hypothetical protein
MVLTAIHKQHAYHKDSYFDRPLRGSDRTSFALNARQFLALHNNKVDVFRLTLEVLRVKTRV